MSATIPEAERQRAKSLFDKYDKDNSGTIEAKEFVTIVKEMKVFQNESLIDVYADMSFKNADKDKSGKLDFEEFCVLYHNLLKNKDKQ